MWLRNPIPSLKLERDLRIVLAGMALAFVFSSMGVIKRQPVEGAA